MRGDIPPAEVSRALTRHGATVWDCLERGVAPDEARVTMYFLVSPAGTVTGAGVASGSFGGEADACLVAAARGWTFPAPEGGGTARILYSFRRREAEQRRSFAVAAAAPDPQLGGRPPPERGTAGVPWGDPFPGVPQERPPGDTCPLVLAFDGAADVALRPDDGRRFDFLGGGAVRTDWPEAATPWLALDRDGDGAIGSGRELFGSATRLRDGRAAEHGFEALAELDADGDGAITPADPEFARLRLWSDHDGDRRSRPDELRLLKEAGVVSLALGYTVERRCDDRENCGVERATFLFRDGLGEVREGALVDLWLLLR